MLFLILKFAYKRVLMFLSDWWVSFLLLLFLSNLSIVVKKKIGLVCSISFEHRFLAA